MATTKLSNNLNNKESSRTTVPNANDKAKVTCMRSYTSHKIPLGTGYILLNK